MKKTILLIASIMAIFCTQLCYAKSVVTISAEPKETSIYINNTFSGYGYAEFTKPKKNEVVIIRCECNEFKPILTKYYGVDKRKTISITLQQDGFYHASAASGIVNKYFTIDIDSRYYKIAGDNIDSTPAWKLLHQILLNYFDEISTTDIHGGYLQTPWKYKTFTLSEKQIRNRVTIRDISTPKHVAFQIKISSEVAGVMAAKHGEFTEIDRIPKELETLLEELQTRIRKVSSK